MQTARDLKEFLRLIQTDAASLFTPRAAMATLIRTLGPTFRRPGSRMLIGGDGRVVRGLSGGCPEADLVTRSERVIRSGMSERIRYNREYGFDALVELGCGGELEVLLEPLHDVSSLAFLPAVAGITARRRRGHMATLFPVSCAPDARPVRRLVWSDEPLHDGIGDAALVETLRVITPRRVADCTVAYEEVRWQGEALAVLHEALLPPLQLVIVGRNVVADCVARLARELGWTVLPVDPRRRAAAAAGALLRDEGGAELPLDERTYCLVMNYSFETDLTYAGALLDTTVPYVGVLGSRARAQMLRKCLVQSAGTAAGVVRLFSPAGLDIGSEDPEEIAVSLVAEIQALSSGKAGGALSRGSGPIHEPRARDLAQADWPGASPPSRPGES